MNALREHVPCRREYSECCRPISSVKEMLRQDFGARCAYCGDSDVIGCSPRYFHVDHFAPKKKFPLLEFAYENLVYSCPYCNGAKSDYWAGKDQTENIVGEEGIANPCTEEYDRHFERHENGTIIPKTELGCFMYRRLKLYLRRHHLIYKIERLSERIEMLKKCDAGQELSRCFDVMLNYYKLSNIIDKTEGRRVV